MVIDRLMRGFASVAVMGATLVVAACSTGGPPQTSAVRPAGDARIGEQVHREVLTQYGGAYEAPVADYVRALGQRIAAVSEQPNARWNFVVLDTPVVNAFAVPGGYIYVTRGLIALADDEAELAGVIGHEIGHVTAGHSAERRTSAGLAQIGVLAAVIGAAALGADGAALDMIGQAGTVAGQGVIASYSRAQELEADRLGVRYLGRAGYDPFAQADFLDSLAEQSALHARLAGRTYDPNRVDFFATHPATTGRAREAAAAVVAEGFAGGADANRNRSAFLRAVDGMTYGDSRAQGFVRGGKFIHPQLRLTFEAPRGWRITNTTRAVRMSGPGGTLVFDGGRDPGGSLERYVSQTWAGSIARRRRVGRLQDLQRYEIGGLSAAAAWLPANLNGNAVALRLTAIRAPDGRLWRFLGVADPNNAAAMAAVAEGPGTFRRLSTAEAARARPWRLTIRTVQPGDTVRSLAARMPFDDEREARFRVLNGLSPSDRLSIGEQVKLVVE